jgi:hypothetical protein
LWDGRLARHRLKVGKISTIIKLSVFGMGNIKKSAGKMPILQENNKEPSLLNAGAKISNNSKKIASLGVGWGGLFHHI